MKQNDQEAIFRHLLELTKQFARGDYSRADELFDLTKNHSQPMLIEELAESFGMMMVQVEGRQFRLEQLIEELKETNQQLENTLKKVKLLESIQSHLSKFVPQSVQDLIETNPTQPDLDKRDRDVSILFLDVAGYTKMSEKVDRDQMNYLIERYFSAFLDVIHDNHGDINETAGDGLMIIFMDAEPALNAKNAVGTALGIQNRVLEINRHDSRQHEPITINIGINSGNCSVGSTRFEGVSGTRWTFTASGPVTNMAARLGALATDGRILIGPDTNLWVMDDFRTRDFGEHRLKNVAKAVKVFEVLKT